MARRAFDRLVADARSSNASTLAMLGVPLHAADDARELNGDPASDERIARIDAPAFTRDAAALVVRTSCGNAWVVAVAWSGGRWQRSAHVPLVTSMQPGRCGETVLRSEALAITSDARTEVAVMLESQDVTGDTVVSPQLSVYRLRERGALDTLLSRAPFGSFDEATGATTIGRLDIIEELPPPRALVVSILRGERDRNAPPSVTPTIERTYRLHDGRLELSHESRADNPSP